MNADSVNKWLTLSANIGVVIGLVLLIVEIGQNTEMMRAQINQSRTDTAMFDLQGVFNSDYIPALLVKRDRGEPFSALGIETKTITFGSITKGFSEKTHLVRSEDMPVRL
jgi:hypothetical protein